MVARPNWARLRRHLIAQPQYAAVALVLPTEILAGRSADANAGRALQGVRVPAAVGRPVEAGDDTRQIKSKEGGEVLDDGAAGDALGEGAEAEVFATRALELEAVRDHADAAGGEGWADAVLAGNRAGEVISEVAFYGLRPAGGDPLHDWVRRRLESGAGLPLDKQLGKNAPIGTDAVVDVDSRDRASESDVVADGFSSAAACEGVLEVSLSLLGTDMSPGVADARKALRVWSNVIRANISLVAAQEGYTMSRKGANGQSGSIAKRRVDMSKVERLTLALDKAEETLGKVREKADRSRGKSVDKAEKAAGKAAEKAAKTVERAAKEAGKVRKAELKAAKAKRREEDLKRRDMETRKRELQKQKQASFMSMFVKKATPKSSFGTHRTPAGGIRVGAPSRGIGHSELAEHVLRKENPGMRNLAHGKQSGFESGRFPEHGLPLLKDSAYAPCSRWLMCLVPFLSPDSIESCCSKQRDDPATGVDIPGTLASLFLQLGHARARRRAAASQLPEVLRELRRTRREPRNDLAPRFAKSRADLRGRAPAEYGAAPIKLLQFDKEFRPPYCGTMRRRSKDVRPRHPFGKDPSLEYEYDSADDWEEEEDGEELSDDEKDKELEDMELKTLGMFGSDSESDDDDFLDDGGHDNDSESGEDEGGGGGNAFVLKSTEEDWDEEDDDGCASKRDNNSGDTNSDDVIVVNEIEPPSLKRRRTDGPESRKKKKSEAGDRKRERQRLRSKFLPPAIVIAGIALDPSEPNPILDRYPSIRMTPGARICMFDASKEILSMDEQGATERKSDSKALPRRKHGSRLESSDFDILARIIHENCSRGRDAFVEMFMAHLRAGGFKLPTKAEVHRSIDILAMREKGIAGGRGEWHLKDASTIERLGLTVQKAPKQQIPPLVRMLTGSTSPPVAAPCMSATQGPEDVSMRPSPSHFAVPTSIDNQPGPLEDPDGPEIPRVSTLTGSVGDPPNM